jgi:protein-disulfide isomerase
VSRFQFFAGLLALGLAVGCKAQPASVAQGSQDLAQNRRIEVLVRTHYNVAPNAKVLIGARKPSEVPGFETLPVTLSLGGQTEKIDFLISTDGKTLGRLEKFGLADDPTFSIDVAGRPIRGNPAAKVTVVSYDDLECPYCAKMHETLFPATLDHYKDQVRFIYKDNPLVEIHPWALHAAIDADCLSAQNSGTYWTYVDYVHSHGQEVGGSSHDNTASFAALDRIARQEGILSRLDAARLDACLAKQDDSVVRASMHEADLLKIEGAPALFVDGERISGALPQDEVWTVIDRALRAAGVEPPPPPAPAATTPVQAAPAMPTGAAN